jgi:hypothetical protein
MSTQYVLDVEASQGQKRLVFRPLFLPLQNPHNLEDTINVDWDEKRKIYDILPEDTQKIPEFIAKDQNCITEKIRWVHEHPQELQKAYDGVGWALASAPPCAGCGHAPYLHNGIRPDGTSAPVMTMGPPNCQGCLLAAGAPDFCSYIKPNFSPQAYLYVQDILEASHILTLQTTLETISLHGKIHFHGPYHDLASRLRGLINSARTTTPVSLAFVFEVIEDANQTQDALRQANISCYIRTWTKS